MKAALAVLICLVALASEEGYAHGQVPVIGNQPTISVNAQTGTTYTVANTDFSNLVTLSNVGAVAVTLPKAGQGGFGTGWYVYLENIGAGTVTITPTTSTIDGAATLVLTTNQGAMLVSNGSNYASVRGIGGGSSWASGGATANLLCKSNGSSQCVDSSITDNGIISTSETFNGGAGTQALPGVTSGFTNEGLWGIDSTHEALVGNGEARIYSSTSAGNFAGFTTSMFYSALSGKDFGSASFQWRDLYLSGAPKYNGLAQTYFVTSDFTTSGVGTALETITGLSWTFPASTAMNVRVDCYLNYLQNNAAVAVAFGFKDTTVAPTNLNASGIQYTNTTASTEGTVAASSTTTATPIVSATPSAITTIWQAQLHLFIEQPSNASTSVFAIQTSTATAADTVTVKRGSYCTLQQ